MVENELSLLYTVRSHCTTSHAGDICFPGGNFTTTDGDVVTTARRELFEEIGLSADMKNIWGILSPITRTNGMVVFPIVGYLEDIGGLCINPREVKDYFTLPYNKLCAQEGEYHTNFRVGKTVMRVPFYHLNGYRIWGLTAYITHHLLS